MVDQLLRRKQEELLQRWKDREKRLEEMRAKEKAIEERGRKRRRIAESSRSKAPDDDEDAEWMLEDWEDRRVAPQDTLSGLSKESREMLEKIGLGAPKRDSKEEENLEESIKVSITVLKSRLILNTDAFRYTTLLELTHSYRNSLQSCGDHSSHPRSPKCSSKIRRRRLSK